MVRQSEHSVGPLSGYRVLELCTTLSGPFATMFLADQGADVIKIETEIGDQGRQVGSMRDGVPNMSTMFINANRNKRSVVLDLKTEAGMARAREIAASCDVVVQNFRPGVVERLGLGYEQLRTLRPDIILVSISGLGEGESNRKRRVYDVAVQGIAGYIGIQTHPVSKKPWHVQNALIDKITSLLVFQATTAALLHRERFGIGQHVKVNMLDAALSFIWPESMSRSTLLGEGIRAGGMPSEIQYVYQTADDFIVFGFVSNDEFAAAMQVLERDDLVQDPRFATISNRYSNTAELNEIIAPLLMKQTTAGWLDRLKQAQAVYSPVNRPDNIHLDPAVIDSKSLVEREHKIYGRYRQPDHPISFSESPANFRHHAPLLGEHTEEVLAESRQRTGSAKTG